MSEDSKVTESQPDVEVGVEKGAVNPEVKAVAAETQELVTKAAEIKTEARKKASSPLSKGLVAGFGISVAQRMAAPFGYGIPSIVGGAIAGDAVTRAYEKETNQKLSKEQHTVYTIASGIGFPVINPYTVEGVANFIPGLNN